MIRNATASDAAALWAVRMAAIQALATNHYSAEQLSAWCAARTVASYVQPIREKVVLVAALQSVVVGYAQLDAQLCEVQALYVHPTYGGKGIGTTLLHALEERAQSLGIVELQLEASLNAAGFYVKAGYRPCMLDPAQASPQPASESVTLARIWAVA